MFHRPQLGYAMMEQNAFADRFFHSSLELTDFRKIGERDTNTLFSFLNNLCSLQNRFRKQFHSNTSRHPGFKLPQMLRDYHYHVGDIDEFRAYNVRNEFMSSHPEMIIIPLYIVAKAILNAKKWPNVEREAQSVSELIDDFEYISANDSFLSERHPIISKGKTHYPGFDIYRRVYSITNIIVDIY